MPVGRHRKPFSSKQKKEQLQEKREKKRNRDHSSSSSSSATAAQPTAAEVAEAASSRFDKIIRKINEQPSDAKAAMRNRFNLYFLRDTPEILKELKKDASKKLNKIKDERELEIDIETIYKPNSALDMPIRPNWSFKMSREDLEGKEKAYFQQYLQKIFENFNEYNLSYFEMNLETWRQLWRVLELSDIILFIVDIRFPVLHFSPVFYDHVTKTLQKDVILVLNKIDLVEPELVVAWKHYFQQKFPNLHIVTFTSQPKSRRRNQNQNDGEVEELKWRKKLITAYSHHTLYEAVKKVATKKFQNVNIDSWMELIRKIESNIDIESLKLNELAIGNNNEDANDAASMATSDKKFITIGCCGFPNVGKSSVLNSLFAKNVVSVSRTPGHTKHLQTLYLTSTVRLCDCPGLVFPSLVTKPLQILAGIYPVAQLQEPYSAIRYISERIPITEQLKLTHPSGETEWSPLDVCEAWAVKRRYYTAKAARPDVYRAANELLRMSLDGRLCLALRPKNFSNEKQSWINHHDVINLKDLLKKHGFGIASKQEDIETIGDEYDVDEQDDTDTINSESDRTKTKNNDASDEEETEEQSSEDDGGAHNRYALLSNLSNE